MKKEQIVLSFSKKQFEEATAARADLFEDIFYCLGFQYNKGSKKILLIKQVLNPYEFEVKRGFTFVEPSAEFLCKLYNQLRKEQSQVILQIHWHKFSEKPEFSNMDDECAFLLRYDVRRINQETQVIQVVFGRHSDSFRARCLSEEGFIYFDNIELVGPDGITLYPNNFEAHYFSPGVFDKNVLTFSKEGMEKISRVKVAVIGLGGIGSGLLYQMARIGFKYLNIIDPDVINLDNCNRLYGVSSPDDAVGRNKVEFVAKTYKLFNPRARIWYVAGSASSNKAKRLLKRADLIILSVDNDSIRAFINSFAAQYAKPLVNVSSGIFMNKEGTKIEGAGTQIQWFIPREEHYPCLRCQGSLNQKEVQRELMDDTQKENRKTAGYIADSQISPEPQVMPLNGVGISIAMWQICCWLAGIQKPEPWTYYDAIRNKLVNIQIKRNPDCTCCGLNEMSILALGDYKQALRI